MPLIGETTFTGYQKSSNEKIPKGISQRVQDVRFSRGPESFLFTILSPREGVTMLRCMLKAKIHMATVTESNLEYEGSITIDKVIMKEIGILPYELVMISNMNNGERFETYAIPGEQSGKICLNGPTARKGVVGDKVIIFCYGYFEESALGDFKPKIVRLDSGNRIIG
jgi:aspartate 1-decarboxylase